MAAPVFAQDADLSPVPYRKTLGLCRCAEDRDCPGREPIFFSERFAAVKKGGKYGYINKAGKLVIACKFTAAKPFRVGSRPKGKDRYRR